MIKKCKVLLHNESVTVIDFDGKEIQMPSIENKNKDLYVEFKNGKYVIVSEDEYDKYLKTEKHKKKQEKDNTKETVEKED